MLAEMVNEQVVLCPKCRRALPDALFNRGGFAPCPNCGCEVRCEVFPALFAGPRIGRPGELLVDASHAGCFFHPEKRPPWPAIPAGASSARFATWIFPAATFVRVAWLRGGKKGRWEISITSAFPGPEWR